MAVAREKIADERKREDVAKCRSDILFFLSAPVPYCTDWSIVIVI